MLLNIHDPLQQINFLHCVTLLMANGLKWLNILIVLISNEKRTSLYLILTLKGCHSLPDVEVYNEIDGTQKERRQLIN